MKKRGDEAKVAIRNVRRDGIEAVKKAEKSEGLPEDQSKDLQDELQKLTDKYGKTVDEIIDAKTKEIMTV